MVSPVQNPAIRNQPEDIIDQAATRAAQKPRAKPQPVQDSVKLSRTSNADNGASSK